MKKTVSMKQFLTEFGGDYSKHMKERLLELGKRCVLTRKDESFILDVKHVEHTKYDIDSQECTDVSQKEYAFGQLVAHEGSLYFSESCIENDDVMQSPVVSTIYSLLNSDPLVLDDCAPAKEVNDGNIDYIIDSILAVCPEVSLEHLAIVSRY
jgi:hypothetical protein